VTVFVLRTPQLMEDEGRHEFVKAYQTVAEAREWIAVQTGYFDPGCYIVTVLA